MFVGGGANTLIPEAVTVGVRKGIVMYIMRRMAQVAGLAGVEHATNATRVVQDAGVPVSFWVGGLGAVPGTVAWTVPLESFAQWADYTERLAADAAYNQVSREGADLILSFEPDQLFQLVHGEIDRHTEVGEFIGSIEATVNPERSPEAAVFAAEIADAWSAATGRPALVVTNAAGDMSTITWLARYEDAAEIDDANAKIAASETYAAALAKGDGLFTSGTQVYARRMA